MRLILIRHGHVKGIEPPRFRGRSPLELTELGREQAALTAVRVAREWAPSVVYTSPLARAVATGAALAARLVPAVAPVADPDLDDIDYGAWQGLTYDEARARDPAEAARWFDAPHLARIPGGEGLCDVQARAVRFFGTLVRRHRDETVAVVAHDSLNRVLLLFALDLGLSHYRTLRQDPCGIDVLEVDIDAARIEVRALNDTAHLALRASPPSP